jgi:hypothetical protein
MDVDDGRMIIDRGNAKTKLTGGVHNILWMQRVLIGLSPDPTI